MPGSQQTSHNSTSTNAHPTTSTAHTRQTPVCLRSISRRECPTPPTSEEEHHATSLTTTLCSGPLLHQPLLSKAPTSATCAYAATARCMCPQTGMRARAAKRTRHVHTLWQCATSDPTAVEAYAQLSYHASAVVPQPHLDDQPTHPPSHPPSHLPTPLAIARLLLLLQPLQLLC